MPGLGDSTSGKAAAREWADRLVGGNGLGGAWRLQRIERRTRTDPTTGKPVEGRELPVRIRRFAKGIPANCVDEAIRQLVSRSPYSGIVFNGTVLEDAYVPVRTWWERDEQAVVDRGQARENTYTIYQDLITKGMSDEMEFSAGGSCSETVEMRYEYDMPSIEGVVWQKTEQGVSYSVQAVSRNDDGTFDYAVVKRTAVTQHTGPVTVKCDEYEKVTVETWENLYGEPGVFYDSRDPATKFSLPDPCSKEAHTGDGRKGAVGKVVEVTLRKNADCTYSATVQRTESKPNPEKNKEGEEVRGAAEQSKQKTIRGVTETTVSRNVEDGAVEVKNFGDRVQVVKNPDGTFNKTVTSVSPESAGEIASDCRKTVFEHVHSTTENRSSEPSGEEDGREAKNAQGGVVYERSVRTTEEGTYDVTDKTTTEQSVPDARTVKQKTLRGVIVTTVKRNSVDKTVPDADKMSVGDRYEVERTPGGLYDRTETSVSPESVGEIASDCRKTVFEHVHSTTENRSSEDEVPEDATDAGGGKTFKVSTRRTEEGAWDIISEETEEIKAESCRQSLRKTLRGVVKETQSRNMTDVKLPNVSEMKVGDSVEIEMTPGGLFNETVTEIDKTPSGLIAGDDSPSVFFQRTSTTENVADLDPDDKTGSFVCGGGPLVTKSVRETEEGSWDRTVQTVTPVARSWTDPDVDINFMFKRTYRFKNFKKSDVDDLADEVNKYAGDKMRKWAKDGRTPSDHRVTTSSDLTDAGLFDGSVMMEFRWDTSTAGQYGKLGGDEEHTLKGGITSKFVWKTYSIADRYVDTREGGFSPVFNYGHPRNWFFTTVQTHMRLVGFGREVLDSLLRYNKTSASGTPMEDELFVFNAVTFDYNEETTAWRFDCILKVEEPSTYCGLTVPTDYTLYARDVNRNYGFPNETTIGTDAGYLRDGAISEGLKTFLKNHVDPYLVAPEDRIAPPGGEPTDPTPAALYPDSCGGSD